MVTFKQYIRDGGAVKILTIPKKKMEEGNFSEGEEVIVTLNKVEKIEGESNGEQKN